MGKAWEYVEERSHRKNLDSSIWEQLKNRIIGNQSSLQFCKSRDHELYLLSCVHRILTQESRLYSPKGLHSALILLDVFLQTLIIFHNPTFLHTYSDLHCTIVRVSDWTNDHFHSRSLRTSQRKYQYV